MKRVVLFIFLLMCCSFSKARAFDKPRFLVEAEVPDFNYLKLQEGGTWAWGFSGAFGVRLVKNLYLKAKFTIPLPLFIVVGNQLSIGGELEYLFILPQKELVLALSTGLSYNKHWPEHIIIILADGESKEKTEPPPFDSSKGLRTWFHTRLGFMFKKVVFYLNIGVDMRVQRVKKFSTEQKQFIWSSHFWIGPHLGFSVARYW